MADSLTIELQDQALLRAINGAVQLFDRPRELMEDIGATIEARANLRFDTKTDPTGAAWPKLSTSDWAKYWQKRNWPNGMPGTLMERTRQLRNSLAHNTGDNWTEIGTTRTVPGVSRPTWEVGFLHEFGTATMPRRGFLTANPNTGTLGAGDQAAILAIIEDALGAAFD